MSRNADLRSFAVTTFVLALSWLAGPASSESLDSVFLSISGREVEVSGWIGTGLIYDLELLDNYRRRFEVVFDAGREARRNLAGCEFGFFGSNPCFMNGKAEIGFEGERMQLIIFEVTSIADPGPH